MNDFYLWKNNDPKQHRNPDRIPIMLDILKECWIRCPDIRLGQLVSNINSLGQMLGLGNDLFNIEDDKFYDLMKKFLPVSFDCHKPMGHFLLNLSDFSEEDSIEFVYNDIHSLIENKNYLTIDEILLSLDVSKQKNSVLLSILTITVMSNVKKNLKNRSDFYNRVKDHFLKKDGEVETFAMLQGLE